MKNAFRVVLPVLCFSLAGTVALAAGLDGRWRGTLETPNRSIDLTLTLAVDGETLTGTIASAMGELPLANGVVEGDHFSFDLNFQGTVVEHRGVLSGDSIELKSMGSWGEIEITLQRADAE